MSLNNPSARHQIDFCYCRDRRTLAANLDKFMNGAGKIHERIMNKKHYCHFMNNSRTTPIFDFANIWLHLSWTSTIPKVSCMGTTYNENLGQSTSNIQWTRAHPWEYAKVWMIDQQSMNNLWTNYEQEPPGQVNISLLQFQFAIVAQIFLSPALRYLCIFPLPQAVFLSFFVSLFSSPV